MTQKFNQPLGGNDMPRFGGIATIMRLPHVPSAENLDVGLVVVILSLEKVIEKIPY